MVKRYIATCSTNKVFSKQQSLLEVIYTQPAELLFNICQSHETVLHQQKTTRSNGVRQSHTLLLLQITSFLVSVLVYPLTIHVNGDACCR